MPCAFSFWVGKNEKRWLKRMNDDVYIGSNNARLRHASSKRCNISGDRRSISYRSDRVTVNFLYLHRVRKARKVAANWLWSWRGRQGFELHNGQLTDDSLNSYYASPWINRTDPFGNDRNGRHTNTNGLRASKVNRLTDIEFVARRGW